MTAHPTKRTFRSDARPRTGASPRSHATHDAPTNTHTPAAHCYLNPFSRPELSFASPHSFGRSRLRVPPRQNRAKAVQRRQWPSTTTSECPLCSSCAAAVPGRVLMVTSYIASCPLSIVWKIRPISWLPLKSTMNACSPKCSRDLNRPRNLPRTVREVHP